MKIFSLIVAILLAGMCSYGQEAVTYVDLSGTWGFRIDSQDQGIGEQWFDQSFQETVRLPGSMAENGKGNDITVRTKWTGKIVDQSWFTADRYASFRADNNVKIPFWLQPERHYIGAAWYQKEIEIPSDWENQFIELWLERPHWETRLWVDDREVGMRNSLGTGHRYDLTTFLTPGKHTLSIRVDNRVKEIDPGENSHSISDHTQSNWNGIVGEIQLRAVPGVVIDAVKLFPDISKKEVVVNIRLKNLKDDLQNCQLTLSVNGKNHQHSEGLADRTTQVELTGEKEIEVIYPMGNSPLLWDEFQPNLYTMEIQLRSQAGVDGREVQFGMRDFRAEGTRFTVNGRPVFLRGTLECAIFPKTGYPPTDVEEWKRILNVCKAHGLNHMRFHSWCPPKAAFEAADEVGVYLQVECSSWANSGSSIGDGKPIDQWLYKEAQHILDAYGNHPSFCMMAYGNEPAGEHQADYLRTFIDHWREKDSRRVYTGGAGWPFVENADYYNHPGARIQAWGGELNSVINKEAPQTTFDYAEWIEKTAMPYVSHEIGQWCVYPNFKEIKKYTGVLKAKNFEIFQETLEVNHLGHLADSFLLASGKLQALCYKADIEASLRTPGMAGFQLLDLHDFPGQGTALVGVLDPFWEEKGYISPEEYSRFCNETVPLARLEKRIFYEMETIEAVIEVAHFGKQMLKNIIPSWELTNSNGEMIAEGTLPASDISYGNGIKLGKVRVNPGKVSEAQKLILTVDVAGFANSWDLWVYPREKPKLKGAGKVKVISQLDSKWLRYLNKGGKVLLTPPKGSVKPEKGGQVGIGFSSIFWNTAWTRGQKPHTLGILCNPDHPALADFPTAYHSNWQWWDAMSHSNAIILDGFTPELKPIVRVIDDWFTNRSLGLVFEARVGKGKLIVSGVDLLSDQENRPEAQQLLYSLKKYMASDLFEPKTSLDASDVVDLFREGN